MRHQGISLHDRFARPGKEIVVHRISAGTYQFGALRVSMKCVNGKLIARVGGGWLQVITFASHDILV